VLAIRAIRGYELPDLGSVRSAQIGVYRLLTVEKEVTPVYTGVLNPIQWVSALRAFLQ
jgi:myosin-crossreactive antigen